MKKPDMKVSKVATTLEDVRSMTRNQMVANAREILSKLTRKDKQGRVVVHNDDIEKDIVIGKRGIEHGLDRNYEYTAIVFMHLDSYLKHAIKINEAVADGKRNFDSDILLGYGENQAGEKISAYFVVSRLLTGQDELIEFGSLYSVRAKNSRRFCTRQPGGSIPYFYYY
ncbi:hypothetical protein NE619_08095 [Anaerovorax odorimutans]|uniref:Uncharacterized protein n=1 Tax=Anaerovorax odorimutans TaxID=109327 RepID=A0ABT1RNB5_9FIRM|nr:hypothetical protein [Anaerovorax odorimutans]MCQ4636688.1 hypothetical protein [Anaerovorax odorimutans]